MGLRYILEVVYNDRNVQVALLVGGLIASGYIWSTFNKQEAPANALVIEQWENKNPEQCTKENLSDFLRFWKGRAISVLTAVNEEVKLTPLNRPPESATHEVVLKLLNETLVPYIKGVSVSKLSVRIVQNIGIGNMVDYLMSKGELPSAYQPHFVIQVTGQDSTSSVRVISNAFIGSAKGIGKEKYTEVKLCMTSSNLLGDNVKFVVSQIPTKLKTIRECLNEDFKKNYFQNVVY
jgi:hypothetical protein